MVEGARGTARYIAEYNRTDYITTIVNDSRVDKVIKAIIDTAYTGSKGDGKIFVYTVEESYDIGNRKKI
jgi:nitrogen regulatory protein P-II 1